MSLNEKINDKLKARRLANEKAIDIMDQLDICDKEHSNYPKYLAGLKMNMYRAIVKSLKL